MDLQEADDLASDGQQQYTGVVTDAGFDDLVALSALTATERRFAIVSCTSGACETPEAGAGRVRTILNACGRNDVTVVAGASAPRVPVKPWLTDAQKMLLRWFADRSLGAASGPFDGDVGGAVDDFPYAANIRDALDRIEVAAAKPKGWFK